MSMEITNNYSNYAGNGKNIVKNNGNTRESNVTFLCKGNPMAWVRDEGIRSPGFQGRIAVGRIGLACFAGTDLYSHGRTGRRLQGKCAGF